MIPTLQQTRIFALSFLLVLNLFGQEEAPDNSTVTPESVEEVPSAPIGENSNAPAVNNLASNDVTVNLINRLVKRGVLTSEDANDLVQLAQADAAAKQANDDAMRVAIENGGTNSLIQEDDMNVNYIPEPVIAQMKAELSAEIRAQAREEEAMLMSDKSLVNHYGKIRFFGDFRMRSENITYPSGNENTGSFPNFNAINSGAPYDEAGVVRASSLNVDQDRYRLRLRARAGAEIELEDGFSAGFRLATGEGNSPVSTNQSFGASGGNFSKYAIWLDRAYLQHKFENPFGWDNLTGKWQLGRFDNPFFSSEVLWDDDIGLDGLALSGSYPINDKIKGFGTTGIFPIFNTDLNFSSNQPDKFKSTDKWLYAGQVGIDWKIKDKLTSKFAMAYYDFSGVEGKLSKPFTPLTPSDSGNTDATRPSFAQKGNTYIRLRRIIGTASNNSGTALQYQYYGLGTPFKNLAWTGRLDYDGYEPVRISWVNEFIKNIAFDQGRLNKLGLNNRGNDPDGLGPKRDSFDGGNNAFFTNLIVGKQAMAQRGDWMANLGYRYVESDAVIDGFTDSDFGNGGTNLKGFTIGASYSLSKSVRVGARWMSADQIAGPKQKSDIFQFDINAKF
jgi:Putative porin